jgi:hypothetical protein
VSGTPVPEALGDGTVRDRDAYFWKFVTGAHFALSPPEEESRVAKAALSVARGLSAAAVYGFQTHPLGRDEDDRRQTLLLAFAERPWRARLSDPPGRRLGARPTSEQAEATSR